MLTDGSAVLYASERERMGGILWFCGPVVLWSWVLLRKEGSNGGRKEARKEESQKEARKEALRLQIEGPPLFEEVLENI